MLDLGKIIVAQVFVSMQDGVHDLEDDLGPQAFLIAMALISPGGQLKQLGYVADGTQGRGDDEIKTLRIALAAESSGG